MKRIGLILALVFFACVSVVSCAQKEDVPGDVACSDRLMEVYRSDALYRGCFEDGDIVKAVFTSDISVEMDSRKFPIVNVLADGKPDVRLNGSGVWSVNGRSTGILHNPEDADIESTVVCVAYDFDFLYMYMSNGSALRIPYYEENSLWGFSFLSADNPAFPEDFHCDVEGTRISGLLPARTISGHLCPFVEFRGKSVMVNSRPQRNRKSAQYFSMPLEYVLTTYEGKKISYVVEMSELYPRVDIVTKGLAPITSKTTYVQAEMTITDPSHMYWNKDSFTVPMNIRGRGNSTWGMPKKPYRIKLEEKAPIFGISKSKDWALLANYSDKSLMRNTLGQKVSSICGMSWVPRSFNVDVFLNHKYIGSYDFTEHKKVASERVDIDVDNGDCYLEIEAKKDNPVWFDTPMNIPVMFSDPEEPSEALLKEVRQWFIDFENALRSPYANDPVKGYAAYIDVDSFVNNFIIQELAKNIDADLFKSLFLVKRKGGKLQFYHQWDFDLAFGNCNYLNAHAQTTNGPEGWYIKNHTQEGIDTGWYHYLFRDPAFVSKVKARWLEVYPQLRSLDTFIEECYDGIAGSAGRNFGVWAILDKYVWPNVVWLGDYRLEVDYLKDFYVQRVEWMNSQISLW